MSVSQGDIDRVRSHVMRSLQEHCKLYLAEGIILVILGLASVAVPVLGTIAVTIFLGWLFLISGVVGLITTFWTRGVPGFWWSLISAILGIVVGLLLIGSPIRGAFSLTFLLIAFFFVEGIVSILFALDHKRDLPSGWGWMFFSGLIDLVLGGVIIAGLPGSIAWALGLVVGINMVFGGVALVAMALEARKIGPATSVSRTL
jgi:uncharacterized membrane protein HdeD (DUF308 family)